MTALSSPGGVLRTFVRKPGSSILTPKAAKPPVALAIPGVRMAASGGTPISGPATGQIYPRGQ